MDLSNESLYELFLFLDSKELILCSLACWNFYVLSSLESLWRGCIDKEHKELFGREMWYETCKVYRQIDVLRDRLKMNMTITELYTIKRIDASFRQLTALPSEIGHLTNLQYLGLNNNKLTALPSEICHLTNLQWLSLYNNQLTALPSEIGHLTNLLWLGLYNNQLTALPSEIGQLTNLQWLRLDYNQLTALPLEIGHLPNLRELYVSKLTKIPQKIQNMHYLRINQQN